LLFAANSNDRITQGCGFSRWPLWRIGAAAHGGGNVERAMTTQKSPNNRGNKTGFSQLDQLTTLDAGANRAHTSYIYRQSRTGLRCFLILSICFIFFVQWASAQDIDSSAPNAFHCPGELHNPDELSNLHDPNERSQRFGSIGTPCFALESRATVQRINRSIYEHWITATSCGQTIKVQVCYHKTDDCIVMNLHRGRAQIQLNVRDFQYDAKER
jgi:hypothetical protein